MKFLNYSFLLFFWGIFSSLLAQNKHLIVQHITSEHGLAQNFVTSIIQDTQNFMWFGTQNGFCRFDGYNFMTFRHDKTKNSLSYNYVQCLAQDKNGNLWIGTRQGLSKYIVSQNKFINFIQDSSKPKGISANWINKLFVDKDKNLWIGTKEGGLDRIEAQDLNSNTPIFQHFTNNPKNPTSISNNTIKSIYQTSDGFIWIGTEKGINRFDTKTQKFSGIPLDYINNNIVRAIYEDSHKVVWIGTTAGVACLTLEGKPLNKFFPAPENPHALGHGFINSIAQDKAGNLLIGTLGGLFQYDAQQASFTRFPVKIKDEYALNNEFIHIVYCDKTGVIWIGTELGGINKYNSLQKPFYYFAHEADNPNSINHNLINSLAQDSLRFWIGTAGGGLNAYNKQTKQFTFYKQDPQNPNSISFNFVSALKVDKDKNLWAGTWGGGLNKISTENGKLKFTQFPTNPLNPNALPYGFVSSIFIDPQGYIWIGTSTLSILDPKTNQLFSINTKTNLGTDFKDVGCLSFDGKNIWVGSPSGVYRIEYQAHANAEQLSQPQQIFFYQHDPNNPKSLNGNSIIATYCDKAGNVWFSSLGNGLNKLEKLSKDGKTAEFSHYNSDDGLSNNVIYNILEDNSGNLWLSTDNGLSKFNPQKKVFRNYYLTDGLQTNQFYWSSAYKDEKGNLYFGSTNGINYFNPDSIVDNPFVPQVAITDFKIFNKPVEIDEKGILKQNIEATHSLELSYRENVFSLEFAALIYDSPEKTKYAYKLEGFETDWTYVDYKRRFVTYTNLEAGEYTFKVKACNSDGVWNENPTCLQILITPPFWKTWWFRLLVSLTILGSATGFYKIRVNALNQQKEVLERKVAERTLELQESNILLEERQEEILQQTEEIVNQKTELEKTYESLQIVSDFGQKVTAQLSLEAINSMIYKYIRSLMDISAFGIGIYNPKRNEVEFKAFMENEIAIAAFTKNVNDENSLTAWAVRNRKTLFINDLEREYKNYVPQLNPQKVSKQAQSLIHIPLIAEDRMVGIIALNSFKKNAYNQKDLNTLATLASYITIALDNTNAYSIVKNQHQKITHSINYAQTIQQALLPKSQLNDLDYFVIYKPKDVVSGDFYWYAQIPELNIYLIAVVDCTGHGVPGAFMSLIGNLILNETVLQGKIYEPAQILTEINTSLKAVLNQSETKNDDGMDICLCSVQYIDNEKVSVIFAGAKRKLFYFDGSTIITVKGDLKGIGGKHYDFLSFHNHELKLNKGDVLYFTSDGYTDQNNSNRKEFGSEKFIKLLNEIGSLSTLEQKQKLETALIQHQENEEQRDDITVLGLRL